MKNETASEERESLRILSETVELQAAAELISRGMLDEAEEALNGSGIQPHSMAALDLLARIAVQRGQLRHARHLWKSILEREPANEPAKQAVARLDSSWLVVACCQRIGWLIAIAATISCALFGVYCLVAGDSLRAMTPATETCGRIHVDRPSHASIVARSVESKPEIAVTAVPVARETRWSVPSLAVAETTVSTNDSEAKVVFDAGLFSFRCNLDKSAHARLAAFASAYQSAASNWCIVVEGHTDADPVPPGSAYRDNYELGLHRAVMVAEVLRNECGVAPAVISVTTAGESDPPFAGTDEAAKRRNRTVVLRVRPPHEDSKVPGDAATPGTAGISE